MLMLIIGGMMLVSFLGFGLYLFIKDLGMEFFFSAFGLFVWIVGGTVLFSIGLEKVFGG